MTAPRGAKGDRGETGRTGLPGARPSFPPWLQLVRATLIVIVICALAFAVQDVSHETEQVRHDLMVVQQERHARISATCDAAKLLPLDIARLHAYEQRLACPLTNPLPLPPRPTASVTP